MSSFMSCGRLTNDDGGANIDDKVAIYVNEEMRGIGTIGQYGNDF